MSTTVLHTHFHALFILPCSDVPVVEYNVDDLADVDLDDVDSNHGDLGRGLAVDVHTGKAVQCSTV